MRHALNVHPLWAVTYYVISGNQLSLLPCLIHNRYAFGCFYHEVSPSTYDSASLIRFVQIFYDSVSYKGEKMFRIA